MTDLTRLYAMPNLEAASDKAGFWKKRGYHVAVAGPTDAIQLRKGEDQATTWESGEASDWYIILASKAPIEIVAAKVE